MNQLKKVNNIDTTDTSDLFKNTKINKIEKKITYHNHDKYITAQEFNKLTAEKYAARLKQANLASKTDIADFVKKDRF